MNDEIDLSREMWNDPEIIRSGVLSKNIRMLYFTHLYQSQLFEELMEEFDKIEVSQVSFNDVTIAIAALHGIGTPEAFNKASKIMHSGYAKKREIMTDSIGFR